MAKRIGITRDIGKVSTTTTRPSTIGIARDIARPEAISAKPDLTKYVKLGDGTYVDKKSFERLPEDVQKVGKLQGYSALQNRIKDTQGLISTLKPYSDESGNINLIDLVKSGDVDVEKLVERGILPRDSITKAENYIEGMEILKDYILPDGRVDLYRALYNHVDTDRLIALGLYTQKDIAYAEATLRDLMEAAPPELGGYGPPRDSPQPEVPVDPAIGGSIGYPYSTPVEPIVQPVPIVAPAQPAQPVSAPETNLFDPITGEYIGLPYSPTDVKVEVAGGWKPSGGKDAYSDAPQEYIDAVIKSFVPSLENPLPPFAGRWADKEGKIFYDTEGNKVLVTDQQSLDSYNQLLAEKIQQVRQDILDTQYEKLPDGQYYPKSDYDALTPDQQIILKEQGVDALRQNIKDQFVELPDGQYYPKSDYDALTPDQQIILKEQGVDALQQNINQLNEKFVTFRTGYSELAEPMMADGLVLAPPVISPDTIAQLPPTFDTNKIYDALAKGEITEAEIKDYFGADEAKVIIEGKAFRDTLRDGIAKIATDLGVTIADINNPTVTELQALIEKDPNIAIALKPALYDVTKVNDAITNIDLDRKLAVQKIEPYGISVIKDEPVVQSLVTLAKFQRDNPDDTETLKKAYGEDTYNEVKKYNDEVGTFVKDFDNLLAKRSEGGFLGQGKGALTSDALRQLESTRRAFDQLGIKYGYLTKDATEYTPDWKVWNGLDYDTKVKVADMMLKDPARGSWWGSLGADVDLWASENLVTGLILAGVQPITHVIGKQVTLPKARELLDDTYKVELDATSYFKRNDGTIDIEKLKDKISVDDEFKNNLLSSTGDEKPEDLIANLEYYNNGQRVTNMEWATAGATAALDLLGLAAPLAGKFFSTIAGRTLAFGVPVASAAIFAPASIETIFNPKATTAEKVVAGAMPIILVAGGALGLKGAKLPKEASVDSVKATLGQSVRPIDKMFDTTLKDVSKAGTTTKTIVNLKALPEVIVTKINDNLEILNTLADEVMSGRLSDRVRSGVRVALVETKDGMTKLGTQVKSNYESAIINLNNSLEIVNEVADAVMSGRLSNAVIDKLKNANANIKTNVGNLKIIAGKNYENIVQKINDYLENINILTDEIMSGRFSDNIKNTISSNFQNVKDNLVLLKKSVGDGYEVSIQKLNDNLEKINEVADAVMSGKVTKDIKQSLVDIKNNTSDFVKTAKANIQTGYELSIQSLNDKLELVNKLADEVMSGRANDNIKREFIKLNDSIKKDISNLKGEVPLYYEKLIDSINDAMEYVNKTADYVMKDRKVEPLLHIDYLKRASRYLKDDLINEFKIAELESNIKVRIGRIKQLLDEGKITEDGALSELQSLQKTPEWLEHQRLIKSMAKDFNNRLSDFYGYKVSKLDLLLESIARNVSLGDEISRMNLPYDLKWAMTQGDDVSFNQQIEQLKLKTNKLPMELKESTLQEINEVQVSGNEYIDSFKEKIDNPDIDDLSRQLSHEENELNNARRIREQTNKPEIKKKLDEHIPELEKSVERKKTQLAERLKDPFKDVEWFKTVTKEESEAAKVAKVTKELAKREEVLKEKPPPKEKVSTMPAYKPSEIAESFVLPSGGEFAPFYAIVFENGEFTYKQITPSELPLGKIYKVTDEENDRFWEFVAELEKSMTRDEAIKIASDRFGKSIGEGSFEPFVIPKEEPKEFEDVYGIFGEEKPLPTVSPIPTVIEKPIEETKPEEVVQPELELKAITKVEGALEEPQKVKFGAVPVMSDEQQGEYDRVSKIPATLTWRQGKKWIVIPPREDGSYNNEDKLYFDKPLPGTRKFATGKGSAAKTIQIINGTPMKDADLDMGWTNIHIDTKGKELKITFGGGSEAAKERWAQEQAQMDELSKRAYQELPDGQIVERIPRTRVAKKPEGLNKVLLPEFSTDELNVYSVNGNYIRNKYADVSIGDRKGIDFVDGGHSKVYWNLIPEGEVWVEENIEPNEKEKIVLHEINELNDMAFNEKDYNEAHDLASEEEIKARKNPQLTSEFIEREQSEYASKIQAYKPRPIKTLEETVEEKPEVNEEDMVYIPAHYRAKKGTAKQRVLQQSNYYSPRTYLGRRIVGGINIGI